MQGALMIPTTQAGIISRFSPKLGHSEKSHAKHHAQKRQPLSSCAHMRVSGNHHYILRLLQPAMRKDVLDAESTKKTQNTWHIHPTLPNINFPCTIATFNIFFRIMILHIPWYPHYFSIKSPTYPSKSPWYIPLNLQYIPLNLLYPITIPLESLSLTAKSHHEKTLNL